MGKASAKHSKSALTAAGTQAAVAKLRAAGLRPTKQRIALGALLFDGRDRHVTAEALHDEVSGTGANVSLATVYNTLHQFTEAGLLRELVVSAGASHFDTNIGAHHHLYYADTGELHDVAATDVHIEGLPPVPKGAEIERVDVVVRLRRR
jgi:Fur family iron response transcriptional regulator